MRKGGAALVKAMTNLTSLAGLSGVGEVINKPDSTTLAFSCIIGPIVAHIYVHFCQDG